MKVWNGSRSNVLDANNHVVWALPNNCNPAFLATCSHAGLPAAFLGPNQYISDGECLFSRNGQYFAALEQGVLSLYQGTGQNKKKYYTSGNQPSSAPHCALMHPCGQLVIIDMSKGDLAAICNSASAGVWCTPNWLNQRVNSFAYMQDDGNFCVYQGTDPAHQGQGNWCFYSPVPGTGGGSSGGPSLGDAILAAVPVIISGGVFLA